MQISKFTGAELDVFLKRDGELSDDEKIELRALPRERRTERYRFMYNANRYHRFMPAVNEYKVYIPTTQ